MVRRVLRKVLFIFLAIALVVFSASNTEVVQLHWFFGQQLLQLPLFLVVVLSVILGSLLNILFFALSGRRAKPSAKPSVKP